MGHEVNVDNPPGAGIIYNIYLSIDPSNRVVIIHITHGWTIFTMFARKAAEYYYYYIPYTCCVNHIFFSSTSVIHWILFLYRHDHHTTDATRKKGTTHDHVPYTRTAFVAQVQSPFSAAADFAIQRIQTGWQPTDDLTEGSSSIRFFFCSAKWYNNLRMIRSFSRDCL